MLGTCALASLRLTRATDSGAAHSSCAYLTVRTGRYLAFKVFLSKLHFADSCSVSDGGPGAGAMATLLAIVANAMLDSDARTSLQDVVRDLLDTVWSMCTVYLHFAFHMLTHTQIHDELMVSALGLISNLIADNTFAGRSVLSPSASVPLPPLCDSEQPGQHRATRPCGAAM